MREADLPAEARQLLTELRGLPVEAAPLERQFEQDLANARKRLDQQLAETARARPDEWLRLLASAWADYETLRAETLAEQLRKKKRPALKASDEVRTKGRELAEQRRRARLAEWLVAYYEWNFPWLTEFLDLEVEQSYVGEPAGDGDQRDPARHWLSADEFAALPSSERNQRALDRYLHSRKTPWQVGRDYERYVGYLREQAGCRVSYHGIFKGLEDLGRDLHELHAQRFAQRQKAEVAYIAKRETEQQERKR